MGQATNVTISKVFKGKSGEGQYGPWQAWDVYFEGSDNKYSYFSGGKKPEPEKGMKIAYLEFEAKQSGKYTNRNITKMVLSADKEPPKNEPQQEQKAAYINHGECVIELMKLAEFNQSRLFDLITMFKEGIEAMTSSEPEQPEEPTDEPPGYPDDPGPSDDDIPF